VDDTPVRTRTSDRELDAERQIRLKQLRAWEKAFQQLEGRPTSADELADFI
jgi:hypothetical protein